MPENHAAILVVDDSKVIRDLLFEYLTDMGYRVEVAVDGQDGINRALSGDFRLVICDLHMPKRNGHQVCSAVTKAKPGVRFIMTDSLPDELSARAEQAGAFCCLTKPFDLSQVAETVRRVLQAAEKECPTPATLTSEL